MTHKALTILLALIAVPMPAMAGQRTIHANDGNVVGRYTTDSRGTTTLYDANGRVISRAKATPSSCMTACRVRCSATDPSGGNGDDPRCL
jgi:hypothetical protein